jgi:hypothetical protein
MSSSLDRVIAVHAVKFVPAGKGKMVAVDDCDCVSVHQRGAYSGVVQVGQKCSSARQDFLRKNKMRVGHTHKTGGQNEKRRERRKFLRSSLAFNVTSGKPEYDSFKSEFAALVSAEYQNQRLVRHQYAVS